MRSEELGRPAPAILPTVANPAGTDVGLLYFEEAADQEGEPLG